MSRLTKGMYGTEFQPTEALFGLRCGQMRAWQTRLCKNSGWYNRAGERLGWGDLGPKDASAIAAGLGGDEIFIVLDEQDAFWHFVPQPTGIIGCQHATKPEVEAPGADYVAEYCRYIITNGHVFSVTDEDKDRFSAPKPYTKDGVAVEIMSRDEAKSLIHAARPVS